MSGFERNMYGGVVVVVPDIYDELDAVRDLVWDQFGRTFAVLAKEGARSVSDLEWIEYDCDGQCEALSANGPHKHVGWKAVIS